MKKIPQTVDSLANSIMEERGKNCIWTQEKLRFGLYRKFTISLKQHFKWRKQRYTISLTTYPLLWWFFLKFKSWLCVSIVTDLTAGNDITGKKIDVYGTCKRELLSVIGNFTVDSYFFVGGKGWPLTQNANEEVDLVGKRTHIKTWYAN